MKKLLMGLCLVALAGAVGLPLQKVQAASVGQVVIMGRVTFGEKHAPFTDAVILARCTNDDADLKRAPIDADGKFKVTFTSQECPIGSMATIYALSNDSKRSGVAYVTVGAGASANVVNFEAHNHEVMPEFTLGSGVAALGAGAGVVLLARWRRNGQI